LKRGGNGPLVGQGKVGQRHAIRKNTHELWKSQLNKGVKSGEEKGAKWTPGDSDRGKQGYLQAKLKNFYEFLKWQEKERKLIPSASQETPDWQRDPAF